MTLAPCPGCGRMVLIHSIANLTVKCDPTPLADVGEIVRLLTSPNPPSLWMVERNQQGQPTRLRGARPGEPGPVREHRCTAAGALSSPSPVSAPPKAAPRPAESRVAPRTPSSARPTAPSGARGAVSRTSECSLCGHPIRLADVETYAMIELGAAVIDAFHVGGCPAG